MYATAALADPKQSLMSEIAVAACAALAMGGAGFGGKVLADKALSREMSVTALVSALVGDAASAISPATDRIAPAADRTDEITPAKATVDSAASEPGFAHKMIQGLVAGGLNVVPAQTRDLAPKLNSKLALTEIAAADMAQTLALTSARVPALTSAQNA